MIISLNLFVPERNSKFNCRIYSTNSKRLAEFPTIKNNFDHLDSKRFVWQRGLFMFLMRMLPDVVFLFQWSMSVNHQEFLYKIQKMHKFLKVSEK